MKWSQHASCAQWGTDCFGSSEQGHDTPQPIQCTGPSAKTPEILDGATQEIDAIHQQNQFPEIAEQ